MEGIIKDEIIKVLTVKKVFTKHQHGFMKNRSCLTNLLGALEAWTRIMDAGHGVDVIYLDYSKAFDTVPHMRLLHKLEEYGITGMAYRWIESYLTGRQMRVMVRGRASRWERVRSGVPQGSVLGPLLFLLYVNELPDWIANSMIMFADDTKIWKEIAGDRDAE